MNHDWERFFTHYYIANEIEKSKSSSLIDLCSGKGVFIRALQRWSPSLERYVMVDIDEKKLQYEGWGYNKKYDSWHFKVEKIVSPIHLLSLEEKFDVVTCLFAIEHMTPTLADQLLQKAYSLLKPDGLFFITYPNNTAHPSIPKAHLQSYQYNDSREILTANNFFIQKTIGLYGKPSQVNFDNPLIPREIVSCLGYFYKPEQAAEILFICKKNKW